MDIFGQLMQPTILIPLLAGGCIVTLILAIGLMANRRGGSAESRLDVFTRKGSKSASSQAIEIWKDAADANKKNLVEAAPSSCSQARWPWWRPSPAWPLACRWPSR